MEKFFAGPHTLYQMIPAFFFLENNVAKKGFRRCRNKPETINFSYIDLNFEVFFYMNWAGRGLFFKKIWSVPP